MENYSECNEMMNYTCPICLNITVEPVQTECKHFFCHFCLDELMENSPDLEEFKCPMCRSIFSKSFMPTIDKTLEEFLEKNFVGEYQKRKAIIEEHRKTQEQYEKIKILYGNHHELITNPKQSRSDSECVNRHKWTCFVEIAGTNNTSKIIEKVSFGMHPTFGCTEVVITRNPFSISRIGWGTFEIPIKIYFKNIKQTLTLNHYLSFDGSGKINVHLMKIKKN